MDFCRTLLEDGLTREEPDPESVAARFVRYFGLSGRPTMAALKSLLEGAGFGMVNGAHLDGMRGVHVSAPGGVLRHRLPTDPSGTVPESSRYSTRPTRSSGRRSASSTRRWRRGAEFVGRRSASQRRC